MKSNKYQKRFYRDWVKAEDLCEARIAAKETDLQILTDKPLDKEYAKDKVALYRRQIESYIAKESRFLTSLKPINVEINAPKIVKEMSRAARLAAVGPMASVAGAIAEFLGQDLLHKGYSEVIIENGGDIFLKIKKPRNVGIYSGKSKLFKKLSLRIHPRNTPLGICTSSGTVGHSLSFGSADSVVIMAKDATLSDAVATACGNRVKSKQDLPKALEFARHIRGVLGIVIIKGKDIISWGEVEFAR